MQNTDNNTESLLNNDLLFKESNSNEDVNDPYNITDEDINNIPTC